MLWRWRSGPSWRAWAGLATLGAGLGLVVLALVQSRAWDAAEVATAGLAGLVKPQTELHHHQHHRRFHL